AAGIELTSAGARQAAVREAEVAAVLAVQVPAVARLARLLDTVAAHGPPVLTAALVEGARPRASESAPRPPLALARPTADVCAVALLAWVSHAVAARRDALARL